jgi:hypothetical protein
VLAVLGVEVRRRMIRPIHVDHDPVERGEAGHIVIVDRAPAVSTDDRVGAADDRPDRGDLSRLSRSEM